jgi:nitroreductase
MIDIILQRRSIRHYEDTPVTEEQIETILKAAMAAPSAVACDPWRFIVVQERERIDALADGLPYGKMLLEAPLGIVVCGDLEAAYDKQLSYLLQDCSAAIENLLLAVQSVGLGACWIGIHPREDRIAHVTKLFGTPEHVIPVSAIAIGHPAESKPPQTRYTSAYVHRETWGGQQKT